MNLILLTVSHVVQGFPIFAFTLLITVLLVGVVLKVVFQMFGLGVYRLQPDRLSIRAFFSFLWKPQLLEQIFRIVLCHPLTLHNHVELGRTSLLIIVM